MNKKIIFRLLLIVNIFILMYPNKLFALENNFKKQIEDAKEIQKNLYDIGLNYKVLDDDKKEENINLSLEKGKEYIKKLYDEGKIENYIVTDSSIVIRHKIGLTLIYSPIIENTYSSDVYNIYTIQPWYDYSAQVTDTVITLPDGALDEAMLITMVAEKINSVFPNYKYPLTNAYKNEDVSFDFVKSIGKNQIVLWQGHGSWAGEDIHSVLWTKRDFDWDKYENDPVYREDCEQNRIVSDMYNESITSKYIDKYGQNMQGTFIYLGPCQSGYDDVLANAFLNKGAEVVIGNTDTIQTRYGDVMQYTIVKLLAEINENTGKYYTLNEALNKAKEMYGETDEVLYPYALGASPVIFGNENYYLVEEKIVNPKTSDNIYIYFSLFTISLLGFCILIKKLKK